VKRAAVLLLPLVLVAVFLGRDGAGTSAQAAVKQALTRTVDARSSRFTLSWKSPSLPAGLPFDYKVQGVMDYARHRGRISYWADSELIFDGDVTYMKWPMPWRKDSPWLRYEEGDQEPDPLDLEERALRNPIGLLTFLSGASNDVREVGREEIRGAQTIHYEGTLDLQMVVDQAPSGKRAELQEFLDFIREDEPTTVPFGLWVDRDGVAHRLRMEQSEGASVLVEYFDFGIPVQITPPAASEIMSFEDFTKEIEAHATDSDCWADGGESGDITGTPRIDETYADDAGTIGTRSTLCIETTVTGG
jgi:LppX/LprAFG-like lipoprotein